MFKKLKLYIKIALTNTFSQYGSKMYNCNFRWTQIQVNAHIIGVIITSSLFAINSIKKAHEMREINNNYNNNKLRKFL